MTAFTFNRILEAEGIDPANVRLIRHADTNCLPGATPYDAWLASDGTLEDFQCLQFQKRFQKGNLVASFVVTPDRETLFVGLWNVDGVGIATRMTSDPLHVDTDVSGWNLYEMSPDSRLSEYVGRLIIDWGPAPKAFIQYASRQDKPIVELRKA